jgi:4-amino-4-deoxy-L-arabinose transferase-like glycosyltransferase
MTDAPSRAVQAIAAPLSVASGLAGTWLLARGNFAPGGALALLSVVALRWPASFWSSEATPTLTRTQRRLGILAVFLIGVFFRTYRMLPPGLWGDDALNGLLAFDILDGKVRSPFEIVIHSYSHFHALSNYPIAAAFALFGPDLWTLRLPGVVLGSLEVPLVYATAAPLFGAPAALVAAFFFATSPLEIAHDKSLIQVVLAQFLLLSGMCLLVRGLHGRRRWLVPLAALPIGLSLCSYHSAKLAPLIPFVFLGRSLLPGEQRARPRDAAAFAVVFLLASLPAVVSYVLHPGTLSARIGGVSLWPALGGGENLAPLWDSLWRTLMIFHYQQGPQYHWFGLGFDPAFNLVVAFLVLHGLTESVVRWNEPRHFLLLTWAAIGLLPGILSTEAPRAYRVLLATPPLFVWAALPVVRLACGASTTAAAGGLSRMLAVPLIATAALLDFNTYFYRVYTHPLYRHFQGERLVDIARSLDSHGPGWIGYLLTEQFAAGHESLAFLSRAWGITIRDVASFSEIAPLGDIPEGGALFAMTGAGLAAGDALRVFYPGTEIIRHMPSTPRNSWFDRAAANPIASEPPIASFLPVPRSILELALAAPQATGLLATFDFGDRHLTRVEPFPYYAFFPPTFPGTFKSEWRGTIHVPEPGGYRLIVECNGPAVAEVDGVRVVSDSLLAAGAHDFLLRVGSVAERLRLAIYWQRSGGLLELVPPAAWTLPEGERAAP